MSFINTVEHGLAAGFSKLKAVARQVETVVLPDLQKAQVADPIITAISVASGVPWVKAAARVEESLVGWAINFIETSEAAGNDPAKVLGDLVGDVKALAPTVKAAAQPVGSPVAPAV